MQVNLFGQQLLQTFAHPFWLQQVYKTPTIQEELQEIQTVVPKAPSQEKVIAYPRVEIFYH